MVRTILATSNLQCFGQTDIGDDGAVDYNCLHIR